MLRLWRNVILFSFFVVVLANVCLFIFDTDLAPASSQWTVIHVFRPLTGSHYEFRGFKYFSEYLKTFPGLTNTVNLVNNVNSILVGAFDTKSYNNILDAINGLVYVLTAPVQMVMSILFDLINNIIWIFGFFIPYLFG